MSYCVFKIQSESDEVMKKWRKLYEKYGKNDEEE